MLLFNKIGITILTHKICNFNTSNVTIASNSAIVGDTFISIHLMLLFNGYNDVGKTNLYEFQYI